MQTRYADYFPQFVKKGVQAELLDEKLLQYDLAKLGAALNVDRDLQFDYLGLQTLYDRYFLHTRGQRIELPQHFFMTYATTAFSKLTVLSHRRLDSAGPHGRVLVV